MYLIKMILEVASQNTRTAYMYTSFGKSIQLMVKF